MSTLMPPWPDPPCRARSIEELQARLAFFRPDDSDELANDLSARRTDVFIATYPKCGTTLLQQMVHCLRTGGDEDFEEITAVVPWLEMCGVMEIDPSADQVALPRAFKTHRSIEQLPSHARLIHMTRDPVAMADSFYRFFADWIFDANAIDKDEFVRELILDRTGAGNYWEHLAEWWSCRTDPNVLFLCYEDFLSAPATMVKQVASFIDITLTPELLSITLRNTSKDYMQARERQFDDHLLHPIVNPRMGLPPETSTSKVSAVRQSDKRSQFQESTLVALETRWKDKISVPFGLKDYDDLRNTLNH